MMTQRVHSRLLTKTKAGLSVTQCFHVLLFFHCTYFGLFEIIRKMYKESGVYL